MSRIILGIDPGLDGAAVLLDASRTVRGAWDFKDYRDPERPTRLDIQALASAWRSARPPGELEAVLELSSAFPAAPERGQKGQGVASAFNFGHTRGTILGALIALGYKIREPAASVWKARMGVSADKLSSYYAASKTLPAIRPQLLGPRGGVRDGVAEAALLALFGFQYRAASVPETPEEVLAAEREMGCTCEGNYPPPCGWCSDIERLTT